VLSPNHTKNFMISKAFDFRKFRAYILQALISGGFHG